MNIVFWSEEDGCGTTSGMAAIASVCSDAWNMRTILIQSGRQESDLEQKLGNRARAAHTVREESPSYAQDRWEELFWLAENKKMTKEMLFQYMVPVVKGRMYYLAPHACKRHRECLEAAKAGMQQMIAYAQQMADLTFVDCGSGGDGLSEYLLAQADAVVVNISQERQNLDAYFGGRHAFRGKALYLVNQYHQESVYNKKNLNRLYRLSEEELAVIPHNPVFRHISNKGKIERFIRRHMHGMRFDSQYDFMQELMQAAYMVVKTAGFA